VVENYPNQQVWVDLVNSRDTGMLWVAFIALCAVLWLWNARFVYPQLLPLARRVVLVVFFASAVIAAVLIGVSA
jgi:hypothetical protein